MSGSAMPAVGPQAGIVAGRPALADPGTSFRSREPATARQRDAVFADAQLEEADAAASAAAEAFFRAQTDESERRPALLLHALAVVLEGRRSELVRVAAAETALTEVRLNSELSRTTGQLELLASEADSRSGRPVEEDAAGAEGFAPALALGHVPLGPVAVFGASNFPFAFGVLGGDTASALAAGCPVIAKGHPAHPETSQLLGEIATAVVADTGWPAGWFSLLHGRGAPIGQALVRADGIAAVAFTGSTRGGTALATVAAERSVPIPVYAELGGINALYLLPDAAGNATAADSAFVAGLTQSLTGGSGQFCTKPGLLVVVDDDAARRTVDHLATALAAVASPPLLTPGIKAALVSGQERLREHEDVEVLRGGPSASDALDHPVSSFVARVSSQALRADPSIADELFGPALVVVMCENLDDLIDVTGSIPAGLTATIHAAPGDATTSARLLRRLRLRAGRVLFGGFPTGVRVGRATTHGGPYPATNAPSTTSVGVRAIDRFLRPVTYQDLPDTLRDRALSWT
ncbi:aldehyde dehydrogenase family protein [Microbacterium rhizomatis]|uniref:Aldehyde dehydrogenase family protein n=1 Tax=Microbacterium rhizomatis TaxID=1631477 RepID=A0A5J5J0V9_9MICO|nr:aldehyde dehydrogenase family protein [Microbacterium rhizomatis]KAA9108105.1 aldehyde dehydrogenase family protein [Microbacterium rhizomatis]